MVVSKASKCVLIIDDSLPKGFAANAAAVLATALTNKVQGLVGCDVQDGSGRVHPAITQVALPILRASADELSYLHALANEDGTLLVAGFSKVAQQSRSYAEYLERMACADSASLRFLGVALMGDKKKVAALTGSFPLL